MTLDAVKVLLVEDDPVFRNIVASFLRSRGALVTEASDGEVALAQFFTDSFDVLLSDLTMPNMSGLELLQELAEAGANIPAVVMSGNQQMSIVSDALRYGASDYLVKPISDLYQIEHALSESLRVVQHGNGNLAQELDALSYQELNEHLSLLEHNANAAKSVQQQLFPVSSVTYQHAEFEYSLFTGDNVTPYFIDSEPVDTEHIVMYMAHFYPEDNRAAFASVLLRSFVHQSAQELKKHKQLIEPCKMLGYINQRLVHSGMGFYTDIVLVVYKAATQTVRLAQAGSGLRCYLRQQQEFTPLMLPATIQLGLLDWGDCQGHARELRKDEKICVMSRNCKDKDFIARNHFSGVEYRPDLPLGGYFQLSIANEQ
ncbi:response regulator [Shewanella avicenniae]|uniref:Response regulator n=1 Tax=Shewanella avicenniae TaxID=2814294 RepID=A0ABX7QNZ2_9GAMM|nr:response regulator [Shewanella avicenniae]QSX32695.1 response regulator [Shewanella avicenniae]